MAIILRINVGTEKDPRYLYYAGYHKGGVPAGPILVEDPEVAVSFASKENGENVLAGDQRLKGGKVVEL